MEKENDMTQAEAKAVCIICTQTSFAGCLTCRYFADFPEKEFNPATMKRATHDDITRIYLELWSRTPPKERTE